MASEEKSFENLLKEAPMAPSGGTVSLVGTLAQSCEAGKFVLTLQDGNAVTLETVSAKGYAVLGTSVGQTIVRVDVEAAKIPASASGAAGTLSPIFKIPYIDNPRTLPLNDFTYGWWDQPGKPPWVDFQPPIPFLGPIPIPDPYGGVGGHQAGGFAPFALATPHQAQASTLAGVQGRYFTWPPQSDYYHPKVRYDGTHLNHDH